MDRIIKTGSEDRCSDADTRSKDMCSDTDTKSKDRCSDTDTRSKDRCSDTDTKSKDRCSDTDTEISIEGGSLDLIYGTSTDAKKDDKGLREALSNGDKKTVKLLIYKKNVVTHVITKPDMLTIIKNKDRAIMECIALKCHYVAIDDEVIMGCFNNKWGKIIKMFMRRNDIKADKILDPICIIKLLKFKDEYISKKVAVRKLDFHGKHEMVMVYLCKSGEAGLIRDIMYLTCIDSNHNNNIFLKAAGHHWQVIEVFKSICPGEKQSHDLETYLAIRRFGGI